MATPKTIVGECWEDGGCQCMARITGNDAANITQADVTSITRYVSDVEDRDASPTGTALTVANVVFDTLQTDARWTVDSTGYNFRDTVPATSLSGPKTYAIEYLFDMDSGENFWTVFRVTARHIQAS